MKVFSAAEIFFFKTYAGVTAADIIYLKFQPIGEGKIFSKNDELPDWVTSIDFEKNISALAFSRTLFLGKIGNNVVKLSVFNVP